MNNNKIIDEIILMINDLKNKAQKEHNSALKKIYTFKAEGLKDLLKIIKEENEKDILNKECLISIYGELLHPSRIASYRNITTEEGKTLTEYNNSLFDMEESHNKKAIELYERGL